jgi:hypothetical protein
MGWFSPIKGHYPSLGQIDKTLPVATGGANTAIERGMIITITTGTNADGEFKIADGTDANANFALFYIALQDYADAQAGMAGTTGFDEGKKAISEGIINIPAVEPGVPTITGLSLSMEGEYETDQYDEGLEGKPVGTPLTVSAAGKLADGTGKADEKVIGYLTGVVSTRWVNNALAKGTPCKPVRQGKNVSVIRFRTK